jgi:hypothetical protein
MLNKIYTLLPAAVLLAVFARAGSASLLGTSVDGSLIFGGDPSNYFDPGNGFVPGTGYLNVSGTTVTVSDSSVEFGFDDGSSLISANFSDNQLTVQDLIEQSGASNSFQMVFRDAAFAGQYLIPVSDSFPFGDYSVVGDVMTLDYGGGNPAMGQTLSAEFIVTSVPEPSTFGCLGISALAAVVVFFACGNVRKRELK